MSYFIHLNTLFWPLPIFASDEELGIQLRLILHLNPNHFKFVSFFAIHPSGAVWISKPFIHIKEIFQREDKEKVQRSFISPCPSQPRTNVDSILWIHFWKSAATSCHFRSIRKIQIKFPLVEHKTGMRSFRGRMDYLKCHI